MGSNPISRNYFFLDAEAYPGCDVTFSIFFQNDEDYRSFAFSTLNLSKAPRFNQKAKNSFSRVRQRFYGETSVVTILPTGTEQFTSLL